jgi:hypothetical protein
MAKRRPAGRRRVPTEREEPPQPLDEILALDNTIARQRMPRDLAEAARTPRVTIYAPRGFDPKGIRKSREVEGGWELELPQGAGLGIPGRKAGRLGIAAVQRGIKASVDTEAFRPPWIDYTPHPKISSATRPLLRKIDGTLVQPHYGVFGADDRVVYYPSGYPWTCVGKLFVYNTWPSSSPAWWGSAVLIGERVLLTAGHVAPWGASSWAMQFIPALYDGTSTLGANVTSWVSDYWGYDTNNTVTAWDMLVCRLYTPLGATYGYFGAKTYSSSWEGGNYWTLAGYPGAVASGGRPARQMWFPTIDDDTDGSATEVEYLADSSDGNSGGPVFGFWSGDPYAIGAHSGGQKSTFLWWTLEDNNVAAGGAAMVNLVKWARSNWP